MEVEEGSMNPLLTLKEMASLLKTSEKAIYAKVARGQLKPIRLGRSLRFRAADLAKVLKCGHASRSKSGNRSKFNSESEEFLSPKLDQMRGCQ